MSKGQNLENKDKALHIGDVSVRYLLVEWLEGNPIIDGAIYFDTKEECLEYWNNLPKYAGYNVEYTICRITNAH